MSAATQARDDRPAPYLRNADLLAELKVARRAKHITPKLAGMFRLLAEHNARRPWFAGYTYREDLANEALLRLCERWQKFNPKKGTNAFAYMSAVAFSALCDALERENRQVKVRAEVVRAAQLYSLYETDAEPELEVADD
jgi:DNA-directed RNA polymerase specialized sigma24 family protein